MTKIKISIDSSVYPGCEEDIGRAKIKIDSSAYPGCEEDVEKANIALARGNENRCERLMMMVYKKQRLFNGDRSHPRLVALDKQLEVISYSGWESDKEKAETLHLEWENNNEEFYNVLKGMGRKQRVLVDRDRSGLAKLDSLAISASYPHWGRDYIKAEQAYFAGFDFRFQRLIQIMEKKERINRGDRTHPRLVALDSLALSYPEWEEDFRIAEESHMNWEEEKNKGGYSYQSFWHTVNEMKEKQKAHLKNNLQVMICPREEEQETELYIIGGFHLDSEESEMDIIGNVGSKESEKEIIGGSHFSSKESEIDMIGNVGSKESEKEIIVGHNKTQAMFFPGEVEQETELPIIGGSHFGFKESEIDIIGNVGSKESEKEIIVGHNETQVMVFPGEEEQETELCIIGGSHLGSTDSEMDIIENIGSKESEKEIAIGINERDGDAPDEESRLAFKEEREDIGSTLQEREHKNSMREVRMAEEFKLTATRAGDFGDDRDRNFTITQSNRQTNAHLVVDNHLLDNRKCSVSENNPPQLEAEMTKTDNSSKTPDTTTDSGSFIYYIYKNTLLADINIAENILYYF